MNEEAAPLNAASEPLRWLARRLVLPALAATAVVDALVVLQWSATLVYSLPLEQRAAQLPPFGLLAAAAFLGFFTLIVVGCGLLLFGLPAGYAVARLKLGFERSFRRLVALGTLAGPAPFLLLQAAFGTLREASPWIIALLAASGAATAAVWTWINADLFRRHNGA